MVRIRLEELEEYAEDDVELFGEEIRQKELIARKKQFKTGRDQNVYISKNS